MDLCSECGNTLPIVLTEQDAKNAALVITMLRNNPWPTNDTRWQFIEIWADEIVKRMTPNAKVSGGL